MKGGGGKSSVVEVVERVRERELDEEKRRKRGSDLKVL